jgi:DNA-3-methyladenine glycosylase II
MNRSQSTGKPGAATRGTEREALRRRRALAACRHLSGADARLRTLIRRIGPHRPIITADPFVALVGSIVQQQISMSAAAAIQKRVKALCPRGRVTPAALRALDHDALRGAGLSRSKARYLQDLADHFATRRLTAAGLRRMSDEEVIETTTAVKGIGRWTAEMLLIFCLERPDVWPIDDLGLRKAVRGFLDLPDLPDKPTITDLAEPWRPYRSYATWYLWRSLEGPLMPGIELT